jgi:hypothetical protein
MTRRGCGNPAAGAQLSGKYDRHRCASPVRVTADRPLDSFLGFARTYLVSSRAYWSESFLTVLTALVQSVLQTDPMMAT